MYMKFHFCLNHKIMQLDTTNNPYLGFAMVHLINVWSPIKATYGYAFIPIDWQCANYFKLS